MAATIASQISLSYTAEGDSFTATNSQTTTTETQEVLFDTQVVGTVSEPLILGDLSNVRGGLLIKNTDPTNFILVDSASTFDKFPQKVLPNGAVFLSSQTLSIYVKADTAPVVILVSAAAS